MTKAMKGRAAAPVDPRGCTSCDKTYKDRLGVVRCRVSPSSMKIPFVENAPVLCRNFFDKDEKPCRSGGCF